MNQWPQASQAVQALVPGAKAATVNATSAWIDVRGYEGDILILSQIGTVTAGSITPTIEDATDGAGAGAAAILPTEGAFTAVTTANDPLTEKRTIGKGRTRGFIRYVGTIVTGPVDVAVVIASQPKNP
jgi:hypothetical protein